MERTTPEASLCAGKKRQSTMDNENPQEPQVRIFLLMLQVVGRN